MPLARRSEVLRENAPQRCAEEHRFEGAITVTGAARFPFQEEVEAIDLAQPSVELTELRVEPICGIPKGFPRLALLIKLHRISLATPKNSNA